MSTFAENLMGRWGGVVARRPRRVIAFCLLAALLASPAAIHLLRHLDANIFNQVSDELVRFRTMRELSEDFGGDIMIAAVEVPATRKDDPACETALKTFGDLLAEEFAKVGAGLPLPESERHPSDPHPAEPWLRQVECRVGQGQMDKLKEIAEAFPAAIMTLEDIERLQAKFEPEALKASLDRYQQIRLSNDPHSVAVQRADNDPLDFAGLAEDALTRRAGSRGQAVEGAGRDGYFISPDKSMLIVWGRPVRSANDVAFDRALMEECRKAENRAVERFRALEGMPELSTSLKGPLFVQIAQGEDPAPELTVGYTGLHPITTENEMSLRWDIFNTTLSSAIVVLALFLVVYWRIRLAVDIMLTMGLAIVLTLAVAAFALGSLGVLGTGFTCILLGMGVDYGIHLYTTFQNLRMEARLAPQDAVRETIKRCGPGILAACLTTMAAFFAIAFTHFRGLAELGMMGGIGLFFSALAMISFFPALLFGSAKGEVRVTVAIRRSTQMLGRFHHKPRRNWIGIALGATVAGACIGLLAFGPGAGEDRFLGVRFDGEFSNLRSLNIQGIPMRDRVTAKFEKGFNDIKVVAEGPDEKSAFHAAEAAVAGLQPYVERGELIPAGGVFDFLASPAQQRKVIAAMKAVDFGALREKFIATAASHYAKERALIETVFSKFLGNLAKVERTFHEAKVLRLADLLAGPLGPKLGVYARIDPAESGQRVRLIVNYFPKVLEFAEDWGLSMAARAEQSVPNPGAVRVTSSRMIGQELKRSLFLSMEVISLIVAIGVLTVLVISFRRPVRVLLALVPLLFALLCTLAGVKIAEWSGWNHSLNYVNIMIFPILIGTGVDYGVYLVHDVYSSRRPNLFEVVDETGRGVLLCGLTTLAGFGSMVLGSYTGLISFGWAAIFGYSGALFGALIVLPALMGWLGLGRRELHSD